MSNNKQSSVEWLFEQLEEYDFSNEDDTYVIKIQSWVLTEKYRQAKEMEKEQIMQSLNDGKSMVLGTLENTSLEQYYKQTYGGGIKWVY